MNLEIEEYVVLIFKIFVEIFLLLGDDVDDEDCDEVFGDNIVVFYGVFIF